MDNRIVAADRICTPSNLSLPLLLMTMSLPFLFFSKHTQAHAHTRTHTHSVLSEVCSFLNYFQDSFRHVRSFLNNLSFIHLPIWSRSTQCLLSKFLGQSGGQLSISCPAPSPTLMPARPDTGPGNGPLSGDYSVSWLPSNRW